MDIENSVCFVNLLSEKFNCDEMTKLFNNCVLIGQKLEKLENNVKTMELLFKLNEFNDCLECGDFCNTSFKTIFKEELKRGKISFLYSKYEKVLWQIRNMLLDKLEIRKTQNKDLTEPSLKQIIKLLKILSEDDQKYVLDNLACKICKTMPLELDFFSDYSSYYKWIVTFLEVDKSYDDFKETELKSYVLNAYTKFIGNLLETQTNKITPEHFKQTVIINAKLRSIAPFYDNYLDLSLDLYRLETYEKAFEKIQTTKITKPENDGSILKSSSDFIIQVSSLFPQNNILLNDRVSGHVFKHMNNKFNSYLKNLQSFYVSEIPNMVLQKDFKMVEFLDKTQKYILENWDQLCVLLNCSCSLFRFDYKSALMSVLKDKIDFELNQEAKQFESNIILNTANNLVSIPQLFRKNTKISKILDIDYTISKTAETIKFYLLYYNNINSVLAFYENKIKKELKQYNRNYFIRILSNLNAWKQLECLKSQNDAITIMEEKTLLIIKPCSELDFHQSFIKCYPDLKTDKTTEKYYEMLCNFRSL